MKIIQINIFFGANLDSLNRFLLKERPDAITMQEVTQDAFEIISKKTGLFGYLDKTTRFRALNNFAFFGNAVLTKGKIIKKNVVRLNKYMKIESLEEIGKKDLEKIPRGLLDLLIEVDDFRFHLISTHLAVRKDMNDSPEKIRQADVFSNYIKSLGNNPFIIGGDLNAVPQSHVVKIIDKVAQNSFYDFGIERTTHPTLHKTKNLLVHGLVVDYVYTSKHFKVQSLKAPVVNVSDHLPLVAEVKVENYESKEKP